MRATHRQTHSAKILVPAITRTLAAVLGLAGLATTGRAQNCVAPPTGLIAWWPGNSNFLSFAGAPPLEPHGGVSFAPGESGQAFNLDGSSGYLQWLSPNSLPLGNQPRTLALWFRTPQQLSQNTEAALIQYGSEASGSMFGLITSVNAPGRLYFFGYNYDLAGTTALLPNTWYFGAVTFDGTTLRLYVNGQEEKSRNASGLNTQLNANGLTVGFRSPATRWTGQLDEVAIWNRALTAAEVQAIYAAGLRVSEVVALTITDIDSIRKVIHIRQAKGRKDRYVMLSEQLLIILRDYWRRTHPPHWLFPGPNRSRPVTTRSVQRAFRNAADSYGLPAGLELNGDLFSSRIRR